MAFPYSNARSPPTNPNRLSGGMINNNNDSRGGLMRRFTTNALPTLSPIGQQRRHAAGDNHLVSPFSRYAHFERSAGGGMDSGDEIEVEDRLVGIRELVDASEPSPGLVSRGNAGKGGASRASTHKRGKSCCGAIGEGRPKSSDGDGRGGAGPSAINHTLSIHSLTTVGKPAAYQSRVPPVSPFAFTSAVAASCLSLPDLL